MGGAIAPQCVRRLTRLVELRHRHLYEFGGKEVRYGGCVPGFGIDGGKSEKMAKYLVLNGRKKPN